MEPGTPPLDDSLLAQSWSGGDPREMNVVCLLDLELRTTEPISFPRATAPIFHGVVHRLIEAIDPECGRLLHERQLKPITLSPLVLESGDEIGGRAVAPGARLTARIGILEAPLLGIMLAALLDCQRTGQHLSLDGRGAVVSDLRLAGPPLTYRGLRQAAAPRSEIGLQFVTPTVFRRRGHGMHGPEPGLVFGSYLRRWQTFAPGGLITAVTPESIAAQVSLHGTPTGDVREVDLGEFRQRGFTGAAAYQIDGDDTFRAEIAALATYSAYCGTGARTAYGMGQTRLPEAAAAPGQRDARTEDPA